MSTRDEIERIRKSHADNARWMSVRGSNSLDDMSRQMERGKLLDALAAAEAEVQRLREKQKEARKLFGQLVTLDSDELHEVWSIAAEGCVVTESTP